MLIAMSVEIDLSALACLVIKGTRYTTADEGNALLTVNARLTRLVRTSNV